ncbi:MAG: PadR family transcriptional regulator [Chloroflexota bacterium]|jgi:DNA-binding PadR family transcriptional regulator
MQGTVMQPDTLDLGRFADPALFILVVLSAGPRHGYAIMAEVEGLSGRSLGPGTLYGALARLESRGLIEPVPSTDRRRPYRLTGEGQGTLRSQLARLDRIVQVGRAGLETGA